MYPRGRGRGCRSGIITAPAAREIYDRAKRECGRRLDMPVLEQLSTGLIAGVTIVFGIVALAMPGK